MQVTAIVVAAGKGKRFGGGVSKPLVQINRRPLIVYSLRALSSHPSVSEIVIVANRVNRTGILQAIKKFRIPKVNAVVLGGPMRQDSVSNGLKAGSLKPGLVLIHDAARPFISHAVISRVIRCAKKSGAAIVAVRVKATVKSVKRGRIENTIPRDRLWEAQTPQGFRRSLITQAYAVKGSVQVTDDASLIERLGKRVEVVKGDEANIKVTTKSDLLIAEGIAREWK